MSQIADYDKKDLEKLCLFARNLRPRLRERTPDEQFKQVIFDLLMSIPYPRRLRDQPPGLHPS
ncbi:MAG: hypothetical protein NPIRA06_34160 [Nitrospirales bacterium]|nr:MAG: hypothetical protein NPIRA06_34160 [Nitrospirales bacterium]